MGDQYYDLLGVSSDASTAEIASAYRERLKETHPDVNDASDAGEQTKRLIEAKEVLIDETRRARYDQLGHERYVSIEYDRTPDHSPDPNSESSPEDVRGGVDSDADDRSDRARPNGSGSAGTGSNPGQHSGTGSRHRVGRSHGAGPDRDVGQRAHREQNGSWGASHSGINWGERNETDWDAVSEAVWEEVTGGERQTSQDATGGSETTASAANATAESETATQSSRQAEHNRTTPPTWGQSESDGDARNREQTADRNNENATATGSMGVGDETASESTGTGVGSDATTDTTKAHGSPGNTAATTKPGTDERGDWTVGWYSEGDPSGTTHDAWSVGGSNEVRRTWRPGADTDNRHRGGTFPPHRILSPVQTVTLFCLCFATYPLLIGGAVFPLFNLPVRLMLALFLVFVVALLIVLPQLGVVVFGSWVLLFPMVFAQLGTPVVAPLSLLTLSAAIVSLGLAALSWLLTRPPVL